MPRPEGAARPETDRARTPRRAGPATRARSGCSCDVLRKVAGAAVARSPPRSTNGGRSTAQRSCGLPAARREDATRDGVRQVGQLSLRAGSGAARAPARDPGSERPRTARSCTDAAARVKISSASATSTNCPPYMTATRSQTWRTVERSCEMKRYERPSRRCRSMQEVEDLRAHRDVERRDRLVADDQRRVGRERPRDRDALALAARELQRAPLAEVGARARRARAARGRGRDASCASRRWSSTSGSATICSIVISGSSESPGSWNTICTRPRCSLAIPPLPTPRAAAPRT